MVPAGLSDVSKKKLSHDQKRKAKLKKRAERSKKHESMAYFGQKYKGPEYVSTIHRTEVGIYESYVISGRSMTDADVEDEIEQLIERLRAGTLPSLASGPPAITADPDDGESVETLMHWNIRRNWQILAEREGLPAREDLIGVLRTILSSVETRRSMAMHPQGYLRFIEGFLKELGVNVQRLSPDQISPSLLAEIEKST